MRCKMVSTRAGVRGRGFVEGLGSWEGDGAFPHADVRTASASVEEGRR